MGSLFLSHAGEKGLSIKISSSILQIPRDLWQRLTPARSPFLKYDFFLALEKSQSIGAGSGWQPLYILDQAHEGILFTFMKNHSYGEYIFDWEWARSFQDNGLQYYPKLTSMIPFTPVRTSHFIMPEFNEKCALRLTQAYEELFQQHNFSSSHFLFLNSNEIPFYKTQGYLIRESMQYHFINEDDLSFEDYLNRMKARKAKHIRQERYFQNVKIKRYTGAELKADHARQMYKFYLSTIDHKNAIDYLKEEFFLMSFELMKENILYIQATLHNEAMAGALFFYDAHRLYGRYWGALEYIENLHFELCYYQGIDFCMEKKLKVFEAGAQGEHKISRGFMPTRIYSAHKMKHPGFQRAIANFVEEEKIYLNHTISALSKNLPWKLR
jgi:uncharacterized protein